MLFRAFAAASFALAASAVSAQTQLTVYTAGPADLINRLAKDFTAKSGVKVNVFQGTTGQVMARVEAEAAKPVVDVLISASWDTAKDLGERGWLLPYQTPADASIPDFLKTKYAVAEGVSALGIAWNPKSGTPRPQEWSDLTKPAFKDLVTIPDPAQSGASFELVAGLQARDGGWGLFDKLRDNGAVVSDANAQALASVLQGAKAAVFGAVDYISFSQKAKGESIEMTFPASGTQIAPRPMMIMKWSKQPDAAAQFMTFVLSPAGQADVAKSYLIPARQDVTADRPLLKDIKVLSVDTDKVYAQRKTILAGFAKALARP